MPIPTLRGDMGSRKVEGLARRHPSLVSLARFGWAAKGVVYGLLGVLAVPIALQSLGNDAIGSGEGEASQAGAVAELGNQPFGTVMLWALAFGLLLYVAWRLVAIGLPAENTAKVWATRAGYLISAVAYAVLAWTAITLARSGDGPSGEGGNESTVDRVTRQAMEQTGGRWLVGLVGLTVVGIGGYFVYKGVEEKFRDELEPGGVGPFSEKALVTFGRVGWIGRGLMMALIGWFVIQAAVRFQPEQAHGIDGALREATESTIGAVLVLVVAVALVVYGAFCLISAPKARLTSAE